MHQELIYKLAQCCSPEAEDGIIGYFKEDGDSCHPPIRLRFHAAPARRTAA